MPCPLGPRSREESGKRSEAFSDRLKPPPATGTRGTRSSPTKLSAPKELSAAARSGGGGTIAVLASGVNRAYPSAYAELFERISQNGVLVPGTPLAYRRPGSGS